MQIYPNVGAINIATLVQTELALSKLRLFKQGFIPGVGTTAANLIAEECDFTGYPAGGNEVTAFFDPILNPLGGASTDWPTSQFAAAAPYTVGNMVGGWWLETAAGDLIACGTFAEAIPIGAAGQGLPLAGSLVFPNGN